MILTCPRCFATYDVPEAAIAGGRMVRCSSCRFEWSESPPPAAAIAGLAPELGAAPAPEPMPGNFAAAMAATETAAAYEPTVEVAPVPPTYTPRATSRPALPPLPRENIFKQLGGKAALSVFVLTSVVAALILFRAPIGHKLPFMADLYEMAGMPVETPDDWFRFDGVKLEKGEADGANLFNVHGLVENRSRRERDVPNIKLYWLSAAGRAAPIVILEPAKRTLAVGETTSFSGTLRGVDASRGGQVKITFLTRDEQAFLKPGEVTDTMFRPSSQRTAAPAPQATPAKPSAAPPAVPAPVPSPAAPAPTSAPTPAQIPEHPATPAAPEASHEEPHSPAAAH